MAKKKAKRSRGDLGKVLDSYGGKSVGSLLAGGGVIAAVAVGALIAAIFLPDYRGLAVSVGVVLLLVAGAYVGTNLVTVGRKVELCAGGVRLIERGKTRELPWEDIAYVEVGKSFYNSKLRWGVLIRSVTDEEIDLSPEFWDSAGGASRFVSALQRYVDDVQIN